jgi:hypothetical protein
MSCGDGLALPLPFFAAHGVQDGQARPRVNVCVFVCVWGGGEGVDVGCWVSGALTLEEKEPLSG